VREDERGSIPRAHSNRRPRCPRRNEEGTRASSKSAQLAFTRALRSTICPVHASGTRRAQAVACRSWLAGFRCGNASRGQRNRHPLVPASSGAKASLACEDRTLVGCARASFQLQKSASDAEAQRSVSPVGNGPRGRGPGPLGSERLRAGEKASTTSIAVAKLRCRRRPEPGVRKSVAGRWFLTDGRHLGSLANTLRSHGREAAVSAASTVAHSRERNGLSWKRRQGCQRLGKHASRWEDNAHHADCPIGNVPPAEANRSDVKQAISSIAQPRKRLTRRERTKRGCWYEDVRWQRSAKRYEDLGPVNRPQANSQPGVST